MRFEVAAAYAMGVGLPLLETLRRKTNVEHLHSYVDDYIAGALLLFAAWSVTTGKRRGPVMLVLAWAVLSGGLYGSFFWQLTSKQGQDVGGLPNATVVAIKGVLYAITLVALVFATRSAIAKQRDD